MNGPYRLNPAGRIDCVHLRLWFLQVACFVLVLLMYTVTLISASFKTTGFPCFFAAVVDYTTFNKTIEGGFTNPIMGGIVPALFFEQGEVLFFFYSFGLVLIATACYMITGGIILKRDAKTSACANHAHLASLIVPPATILVGSLSMWTLQTVVVLLSHKLIVLAACTYLVHFILFTFFYIYFCGRGVNSVTYADDVRTLRSLSSRMHIIAGNVRAVIINIISALYGLSIIIMAIMLEMLMANSFSMQLWQPITVGISVFIAITIFFLLAVEFVVARYVHVIIGAHIGLLAGCGMIGTSSHDYLNRFYYALGENVQGITLFVRLSLGILSTIILIMMLVRIFKAYIYHRRNVTRFYGRVRDVRDKVKMYGSRRQGRGPRASKNHVEDEEEEPIYDTVAETHFSSDSE
ncbi:UL10 [anatid alphaherpesvirus 1]|nr:UL10 [Anatid alphaherpesvirus 1]